MRRYLLPCLALIGVVVAGCRHWPVHPENPTTVVCTNYDVVWEKTIDVVSGYFEIAYENRYDGRIETYPKTAATLLEWWHPDSPDCYSRLEASLQTIRRRAFIVLYPSPAGGYVISVEVYKELEDMRQPLGSTNFGGATYIHSLEPTTEALVTSAVQPTEGWISMGRDKLLEAKIIEQLQRSIDGVALYTE